jgi:hypothetical protein
MRSRDAGPVERSQPIVPMRPGIPQRQAHDYVRHATASLFAALNVATGQFIDHWNDHPVPFTWTKDADTILDSISRAKTKANVLTDRQWVQVTGTGCDLSVILYPVP